MTLIWRIRSSLFPVTPMKDKMDGSRGKNVSISASRSKWWSKEIGECDSIFVRSRWTIHRTWKWRRGNTGSGLFRCQQLLSEESRHVWTLLFWVFWSVKRCADYCQQFVFLSLPEPHRVKVQIRLTVRRESSRLSLDFSWGKNVSNGKCYFLEGGVWGCAASILILCALPVNQCHGRGNRRFFRRFLVHEKKWDWFYRWERTWTRWVLKERSAKSSEINFKSKSHFWQVIWQTNVVLNSSITGRRKNEKEEEERADSIGRCSQRMIACWETFSLDQLSRGRKGERTFLIP